MRIRGLLISCVLSGAAIAAGPSTRPLDNADPFVGTAVHGHTYPGATVPFGAVQVSPDTPMGGWDGCAGYHYSDHTLLGFSQTHLSGTGIGDWGDVLLLPVTGDASGTLDCRKWASEFSHDDEVANPGYYRVRLRSYDVTAELTATAHAGLHRYTFPASGKSHVLIDLVRGINNGVSNARVTVASDRLLLGRRTTSGWHKNRTVYFAVEASKPWASIGFEADGKAGAPNGNMLEGKAVRARLDFTTTAGEQVLFRVGISYTSADAALANCKAEIPAWDFDATRAAAEKLWEGALGNIEVQTPDPAVRRTFYSALYHAHLAPVLFDDADGSFRGPDDEIHPNPGFDVYTELSLWDTYRAENPLLTLVQPSRVDPIVQTLLMHADLGPTGGLPMWVNANYDTGTMIGYHAVPVIADAYMKGFRGFDGGKALEAMRRTAALDKNGQAEYAKNGYLSTGPGKKTRGAAKTLEFSYDDWCIAQVAKALGKTEDAEAFGKRAQNYRNTFDPALRIFRGRSADGSFPPDYDVRRINTEDFAEANAWQYAFAAVQDVPGMIALYGGNEAFAARLDELFFQNSDIHNYLVDVTGLVGQYAHGNEPCHHVAYLYALAGDHPKTARLVRQVMQMHYDPTPAGLCGNDDCGQMSAWYVWSAIGLYPVTPASNTYVIGSPIVEQATIHLDPKFYPNAKDHRFTVRARNASTQNLYVKSATLNGQALDHPWITHDDIAKGGELVLEMDVIPSLTWGRR